MEFSLYGAEHYSRCHRLCISRETPSKMWNSEVYYVTHELSTYPCREPDQSSQYPHPVSPSSVLIVSAHLLLGHPSGVFPSGFATNNLYAFLVSTTRVTCLAHHLLDLIILIILGEEYKVTKLLVIEFFSTLPSLHPSFVEIWVRTWSLTLTFWRLNVF
jgi:hypothetical protein